MQTAYENKGGKSIMIIDNVHYSGIREIYNYIQPIYADWSVSNVMGSVHRDRALNYCSIEITLHDISPIEFLMLQKFTGGNAIYRGSEELGADTIPENTPDEEKALFEKIIGFRKQVELSKDLVGIVKDMVEVPAMERCHAIVRFKGIAILSLFQQSSMVQVFRRWIGPDIEKSSENGQILLKFPKWEELHKEITLIKPKDKFEDFIIKTFLTNFYNFWKNEIRAQDVISDGFIHNVSYNGLRYGTPILQEISCPNATVTLGSENTEETAREIQKLSSWAMDHSKLSRTELLPINRMSVYSEIQMTVNIKSSLKTFLRLVKHIPYQMLNDWEDLLVVIGLQENIPLPEADNFKIRKGQVTQKIWELSEKYRTTNPLRMMDFIPYEVAISYTLMGSVADFTMLVTHFESWVQAQSNGDESVVENNLELREVQKLMESITTFVNLISDTTGNVHYAD